MNPTIFSQSPQHYFHRGRREHRTPHQGRSTRRAVRHDARRRSAPTNLSSFAEKYRLRTRLDRDGEIIIPARLGHFYRHNDSLLGLAFIGSADDSSRDRLLRARIASAVKAGFEAHLLCDAEALLLFRPDDVALAKLAIRLVGAKRKRRQTGKGRPFMAKRVPTSLDFAPTHAGQGHRAIQTATIPDPPVHTHAEAACA